MSSARAEAARQIAAVLDGRAFDSQQIGAGEERALVLELCFGTLRQWPRLTAVLDLFLKRRPREPELMALLAIGVYQLLDLRVADHAAISETVQAAVALDRPWARGLVNGVLRNVQRQRDQLDDRLAGHDGYRTAHPGWLVERLRSSWPQQFDEIIAAGNSPPPMDLRVNRRRGSRDDYLARLGEAGLDGAEAISDCADGVKLAHPCAVERLPGFTDGDVSVQDRSAQYCADLLDLRPGQRVLDACCAPGGKSAHALERADVQLTGIDRSAERLQRVRDTLDRLHLDATLHAADASEPGAWWDGVPFDRVLLDAPCSATGVIRRHPDIKLLRRASDLPGFARQQQVLLEALWPLVAPGGLLVYATCSIMPEENERQIAAFLDGHADAIELPIAADWGNARPVGRQLLPHPAGGDGFYYACLRRE